MPNHVSHKIIFRENCEDLIMKLHLMQEELTTDGEGWTGRELFNLDVFCPPTPEQPLSYEGNIDRHGTKWNAYQQTVNLDANPPHIYFQTAWSTPMPVWKAIAEQFPDAVIDVYYADEDTGHNLGHIHIEGEHSTLDERSDAEPLEKIEILNEAYDGEIYGICEETGRIYDLEYPEDCEEGSSFNQSEG